MLQYTPSTVPARGLCLVVTGARIDDLYWSQEELADELRSIPVASVFLGTGGQSIVDRQLQILSLLQFAESNVPELELLICVDDANRRCVEALLRGRPHLAARVRTILSTSDASLVEEVRELFAPWDAAPFGLLRTVGP